MAVRRSLAHLPAFVLAGTGTLPLLIGLASRYWGWLALPDPFVVVLALLTGTGIGQLSWLGFELGRRRWRRASTSGTSSAGQETRGASLRSWRRLRGFALSVLGFLVLGTLYGLIDTVPAAVGQPLSSGTGIGTALLTILGDVVVYGAPALVPLVNGLLTGARATPTAGGALLGGLALGVCGGMAFLLPAILLLRLIPPSCAVTTPPSCGPWYFGPAFWVPVLSVLVAWVALLVGVTSGVATSLGMLVARLTDRRGHVDR
jgi:hypothetical protein